MKKHILGFIILFMMLPVTAQKAKDVLYLKNGSMIYGKLIEIIDDQYKMRTSDGSVLIFSSGEVEKFAKDTPAFDGRKNNGLSFSFEAGLLAGAQNTDYSAPFSVNFLAGVISNTKNIVSIGSGVEFIGQPFNPLFLEYKHLMFDNKTTPFIFIRGGGMLQIGGNDSEPVNTNYDYSPYNYKGSASYALGCGISWAKEDYDT
jgi:hypothetical protein